MANAKATSGDRTRAATAILDRAGLGATSKTEVSGPGGGALQIEVLRHMTTAELETVRAIYAAAQARLEAGEEPGE